MANEAQIAAGGTDTAVEVSGAIAEHDDCCSLVPPCCTIDGCTTLPLELLVVISGVTACGSEIGDCSGGSRCDCDNANGSYTLPALVSSTACVWQLILPGGFCSVLGGSQANVIARITDCGGGKSQWKAGYGSCGGCITGIDSCEDYENCDHYDTHLPVTLNNVILSCPGSGDAIYYGLNGTITIDEV